MRCTARTRCLRTHERAQDFCAAPPRCMASRWLPSRGPTGTSWRTSAATRPPRCSGLRARRRFVWKRSSSARALTASHRASSTRSDLRLRSSK
ncbi:hypothetical protein T492DRAFT_1056113 [Pavlovales sp. CCMP2436]|nr:hypothetical protein T492DRAFT_1056113 [Pavlovales sp. CCMP2436]